MALTSGVEERTRDFATLRTSMIAAIVSHVVPRDHAIASVGIPVSPFSPSLNAAASRTVLVYTGEKISWKIEIQRTAALSYGGHCNCHYLASSLASSSSTRAVNTLIESTSSGTILS